MEHLLSSTVKLGGDISIAAGPIGAGAKAQTTDILAFARSRGLYGGISLEGAVMKTRGDWNAAYYSAAVTPPDVIYKQQAYNPQSANLQNAVMALANRDDGPVRNLAPTQPVPPQPVDQYQQPQPIVPDAPPVQDESQFEDDAAWGAPVKQD
jgi:hypothetical protein